MKIGKKTTLFILLALLSSSSWARNNKKRVRIKYKEHTQFDFSGNRVSGKIHTPAVFYIFQRKRAQDHKVIMPPSNFDRHRSETITQVRKVI